MPGADALALLAEVGVALAGFTAIAIALGRRAGAPLSRAQYQRVSNLLTLSLGAALFAVAHETRIVQLSLGGGKE